MPSLGVKQKTFIRHWSTRAAQIADRFNETYTGWDHEIDDTPEGALKWIKDFYGKPGSTERGNGFMRCSFVGFRLTIHQGQ